MTHRRISNSEKNPAENKGLQKNKNNKVLEQEQGSGGYGGIGNLSLTWPGCRWNSKALGLMSWGEKRELRAEGVCSYLNTLGIHEPPGPAALEREPRALHILDKHSITKLHPQSFQHLKGKFLRFSLLRKGGRADRTKRLWGSQSPGQMWLGLQL